MDTHLPLRALAPDVCVAPQLAPEHMAELARLGFRTVINNRPDFEHGPEQPTSAMMAAAAKAAGMAYHHLPVDGAHQSPQEIAAFGHLLQNAERPVLAFCRSGARCTKLFLASNPAV